MPATYTPETRQHSSALAAAEKRVLIWMAQRIPSPINSDHLTALGFFSMLATGVALAASRNNVSFLWLAIVFLILNWFGDSLDGTLARVRNQQRPRYGFYLDHILDAIGSLFLFGGLGQAGLMSMNVAFTLTIAYFLLNIEVFLATHTVGRFEMNAGAFGPTELRLLLIAGFLTVLIRGPLSHINGTQYRLFDIGGVCGAVGMALVTLWSAWKHGSYLYKLETKR